MKAGREAKTRRRVAGTCSLLTLGFTSLVSLLVFYTEDDLTGVDCILLLGAPIALSVLAYLVGLRHDPKAPD